MNSEDEPPVKKQKTKPFPPSFLSLPEVIIVNCLARISRSYYPKLSLVCKTFRRFLILSKLSVERKHLGVQESVLHICLQLPTSPFPSWFSLWINPDQTLTNDIGKKNKSTGNTLLVQSPSFEDKSPMFIVSVGPENYGLSQNNALSTVFWHSKKNTNREIKLWSKGPNMSVARERAVAGVVNGKVYVMGGCGTDESANWAEVFDLKTQTFEPLPDPGEEIRGKMIKTIEVIQRKLYLRTKDEKKDYVYDPRKREWSDVEKQFVKFLVKHVWYRCGIQNFLWYDAKSRQWRVVRGLATLSRYCHSSMIDIASYRGKLLVSWDKFAPDRQHKNIWCAMIALETKNDGEVCGKIEWANIVLKVPSSYVFLRRRTNKL